VVNPYLSLVKKTEDFEFLNVSDIQESEQVTFEGNSSNKRKITNEEKENKKRRFEEIE
jgi:hypothetical protein